MVLVYPGRQRRDSVKHISECCTVLMNCSRRRQILNGRRASDFS